MMLEHVSPYSLYLHIPFCTHRCAYCDFNTYAGREDQIPAYVSAVCKEIRVVAGSTAEQIQIHTIFLGGGTPSLLTPLQFEQILQTIQANFSFSSASHNGITGVSDHSNSSEGSSTLETTFEANPGTVSLDALKDLRHLGFNRISFGVQSFHPEELRLLERIHDPFEALNAVQWARKAGFNNLNLDLIYGLPEQTLARWLETLQRAVSLAPEHLSLYALTIEQGTPFGRWAARGLLPVPDPDLAADMYEVASEYLGEQGYEQYEISNWSKPGFQCRHNLQYWRNLPYLGFGAGAHGCANGMRIANVRHIKPYLQRLSFSLPSNLSFPLSPATVARDEITRHVEMQETLMLGLRLTQEGVSAMAFHERFGQRLEDAFGKEINELTRLGLLEWVISHSPAEERAGERERIRLTPRGRLLGNQVFMRFVGD